MLHPMVATSVLFCFIKCVLDPETLAEQVARHLLDEIDGRLRPGDALPSETKLAQQFGVSRPIVR